MLLCRRDRATQICGYLRGLGAFTAIAHNRGFHVMTLPEDSQSRKRSVKVLCPGHWAILSATWLLCRYSLMSASFLL